MENPDSEVEIKRDKDGLVTNMQLKVHNPDEEGKKYMELLSAMDMMFQSEALNPARDINVNADVKLG